MKNVLGIKYETFLQEMESAFTQGDIISTRDILSTYIQALDKDTDVLERNALHTIVYKQCQHNCAFV